MNNNTKELFAVTESHGPDRFFFGQVDGKRTLFVLHWDHSIAIAPASCASQPSEPAKTLLAELVGLAA